VIEFSRAARGHDEWIHSQRDGIHIFGAGGFARNVASAARSLGIKVHAFLVSNDPTKKNQDGIPVRRVERSALDSGPTWVGVFNREAHSDYSALRVHLEGIFDGAQLVWPQVFYAWLKESLGWRFWLNPLEDYAGLDEEICCARNFLEDDESREAFNLLLNFRRMNPEKWRSPSPSADQQYMPPWLRARLSSPLRIVDAGAYHGETLRELSALAPVEQAWTFEPDPANYATLVRNMSDWPGALTNVPAGLSDRSGTEGFSCGNGEGSSFASGGTTSVPIVTLDECLHGAGINFLKLDVEGNELAALHGARATLQQHRPKLAVAGYHRWDDLWRIPIFIAGLGLDYRLRLGLHGYNSFDCVFYAY
jgi:FkbM family methyltransferase